MDLVLAKVWYFFYFGGLVCVWPYLNLFYRSHGLSDAQIGVLAAVKPWVAAPASFIWSGIADRFSAHRIIMLITFVISTLTRTSVALYATFAAFMVLAVVGEFVAAPVGVMADAAVVAACKSDADYGKSRLWGAVAWGTLSAISGAMVSKYGINLGFVAYLILSVPCVICAVKMDFKLGANKQQKQSVQQQQQQQQLTATTSVLGTSSNLARSGLGDTEIQMEYLLEPFEQQSKQKQPKQNSAAAVVGTYAAAGTDLDAPADDTEQQQLLPQHCHHSHEGKMLPEQCLKTVPQHCSSGSSISVDGDMNVVVQSVSGCDTLSAVSDHHKHVGQDCSQAPDQPINCNHTGNEGLQDKQQHQHLQQQHQHKQQQQQEFWQGLKQLLTRPAVLIFMWQATVMGFGIGVIGEFLFLFLQDLGGSESLMGLTLTVTCIAEVPAFHYQPQLLKVVSVHTMLHIVMWAYVVRLGLYALLPYVGSAWAVLPVELLHGVCFGCGWSAGTITSKRVAPPGLEATMQGIFQGLYFGLGQGLGALVGGLLKNRFDGQIMFALCSAICLGGWMVCVLAEYLTGTVHSTDPAAFHSRLESQNTATIMATEKVASVEQPELGTKPLLVVQQRQESLLRSLAGLKQLGQRIKARVGTYSDGRAKADGSIAHQRRYKYSEMVSKDSGPDIPACIDTASVAELGSVAGACNLQFYCIG